MLRGPVPRRLAVLLLPHVEASLARAHLPTDVRYWRAGFGLMVTLVWLYLELLRMLAILQGRD